MKIRSMWAVLAILAAGCAGLTKAAAGKDEASGKPVASGADASRPAQAVSPGSFEIRVKAPSKDWAVKTNVQGLLPGAQPALFLLLHAEDKGRIFVFTFPSEKATPREMAEIQRVDFVGAGAQTSDLNLADPSGQTVSFTFSGAIGPAQSDVGGMLFVRRMGDSLPVSFVIWGMWDPSVSAQMKADLAAVAASLRVLGRP